MWHKQVGPRRAALALALAVLPVAQALAQVSFAPVAAPDHVYRGGWEFFVGGGLAGFDCDGDALPELFAAGGSAPAQLLRNRSVRGGAVRFAADTPPALALTGVTGAYPLDIDGDGALDLAVLRVGPNLLLQGDGACGFRPFEGLALDQDDRWTTAFSATWEAGQALPTLAFGNYVDRTDPNGPFETCDVNQLYRPDGAAYGAPQPMQPGFCPLSMLFSDWGRKGRADLRVSNDRHYYVRGGSEQMWAMEPAPRLYTEADGWRSYRIWGMGIASRDLTGDGLADVYLTSMADQKFQILNGGGTPDFRDAGYGLGTTAQQPYTGGDGRPSTGWHVSFGDVQNDGRDDIFVTKGNVEQMPGSAMQDPNNLLIQTPEGGFVERGDQAGLASLDRGRGAAMMDFNLDGLLDVAVVNRRAPMEIWQNVTPAPGRWTSVALRQDGPNRDAVGAWIELRFGGRQAVREVTVGGGHAGGIAGPQHFGLGAAGPEAAELRVVWPDGVTSDWQGIGTNRPLLVKRAGTGLDIRPY